MFSTGFDFTNKTDILSHWLYLCSERTEEPLPCCCRQKIHIEGICLWRLKSSTSNHFSDEFFSLLIMHFKDYLMESRSCVFAFSIRDYGNESTSNVSVISTKMKHSCIFDKPYPLMIFRKVSKICLQDSLTIVCLIFVDHLSLRGYLKELYHHLLTHVYGHYNAKLWYKRNCFSSLKAQNLRK